MENHQFTLAERTIHVWFADLAGLSGDLERMRALLSYEETRRAERFTMERLRHRFILRRGLLRILLGRCTGRAPQDLEIAYGAHGKPELPGGPAFNLADSEDSVAIAIAGTGALGVDIERLRRIEGADSLAERFFAPAECAALRALPPEVRNEAFLLCWIRKEAFVKAAGAGLYLPLDQFAVEVMPGRPAAVLAVEEALRADAGRPEDWSLFDLRGLPDTAAAVAVWGTGWRVSEFRAGPELLSAAP